MTPELAGRLLIASPHLSDGNFFRSVILMVRHDHEGAFGIIVNRPTERRFRDLVDEASWAASGGGSIREDDHVLHGGPVPGPLLAIHDIAGIGQPCGSEGEPMTAEWADVPAEPFGALDLSFDPSPIWITGDDDHLRILARRTDAKVRFVLQYSGWGPGQLDQEYRRGGWLSGPADLGVVFSDEDDIWELAVKRCGQDILESMRPGMDFGDPNLN